MQVKIFPFKNWVNLGIERESHVFERPITMLCQYVSVPRLQAFAVNAEPPSSPLAANLPNNAKSRQIETRQRQLDMLKRMEERYRNITSPDKQVRIVIFVFD